LLVLELLIFLLTLLLPLVLPLLPLLALSLLKLSVLGRLMLFSLLWRRLLLLGMRQLQRFVWIDERALLLCEVLLLVLWLLKQFIRFLSGLPPASQRYCWLFRGCPCEFWGPILASAQMPLVMAVTHKQLAEIQSPTFFFDLLLLAKLQRTI